MLTRILEEIESPHAAAGAVATVSQEIMGQDIILRAVFQAVEETKPVRASLEHAFLALAGDDDGEEAEVGE